jgi:hypothetical protein
VNGEQELRLPGPDGQILEAEIPKWLEVSPKYGLRSWVRRSQSYAGSAAAIVLSWG